MITLIALLLLANVTVSYLRFRSERQQRRSLQGQITAIRAGLTVHEQDISLLQEDFVALFDATTIPAKRKGKR